MLLLYSPIIVSVFAIVFAFFLIRKINKTPTTKEKTILLTIKTISESINYYFKKQYKIFGFIVIFIFFIIFIFFSFQAESFGNGFKMAIGFLMGVILSFISIFVVVFISTETKTKLLETAKRGISDSFDLLFKGGLSIGLLVISLGLLSVSGFYFITKDINVLISFGFGVSLVSIFIKVGGWIYSKIIDEKLDFIKNIETGFLKDNSKNPFFIVKQTKDNISGFAGTIIDIFQTYNLSIISAMILGYLLFNGKLEFVLLPLFISAVSILTSIIGSFFVRLGKSQSIMGSLYKGLIISVILSAIVFYPLIVKIINQQDASILSLWLSLIVGFLILGGIFVIRTKLIAYSIILVVFSIIISYWLFGFYGVALSLVSVLSIASIVTGVNIYLLIINNIKDIIEKSKISPKIIKTINDIDFISETRKSVAIIYSIISAIFVFLVLFFAYYQQIVYLSFSNKSITFSLYNLRFVTGLLVGGFLIYFFNSYLIKLADKTAEMFAEELRRCFKNKNNSMQIAVESEYERFINVITGATIKKIILLILIFVILSILTGYVLGVGALSGLLVGTIFMSLFFIIWSLFRGDIVKDCALGDIINNVIKILNIVALLIVPFLID